ncbi:MAG: choice-of-anchor V domain-containing protein [bacterium]|nr:choice-of-anchor V domain-containing protein [bacterium]
MRKIITLIFLGVVILAAAGYLMSSSTGKTGQTEAGCTCHGTPGAGNSVINLTANPDFFAGGYVPGSSYTLTINVTGGPVGNRGGFNLKASHGTLTNPGANAKISNSEATHSNSNARSWTVDWVSPDATVSSVVFNYAGNAVNGDGTTSGDDPTKMQEKAAQKAVTPVQIQDHSVPNKFAVLQNYPNPFNANTNIAYRIDRPGEVHIGIFDINGRVVFQTKNQHQNSGLYHINWDAKNDEGFALSSGIYIYQVRFNGLSKTKKLILAR